ncbi:MAG: hypothetical protein J0G30_07905 [Actinomycetales bacterium]|nr:hypothetical protein [Actinomycetales bacterium]
MASPSGDRGIQLASALLLGLISVVTALGVLQSGAWALESERHGLNSADARDQGISARVVASQDERTDREQGLVARDESRATDAALAADDLEAAVLHSLRVESALTSTSEGFRPAWEAWSAAGFTPEAAPDRDPAYLLSLYGHPDSLAAISRVEDGIAGSYDDRAAVFNQAALLHALALFLVGVATAGRLALARVIVLSAGGAAFLAGLVLMATAL